MTLSHKAVTRSIDALLTASQSLEEQLAKDNVLQAHDWMFAIREVLYDLRRLNLLLADMYNTTDVGQTPLLLQGFVRTVLYEVIPHVQSHMSELEEELAIVLPEADIPDEEQDE